MPLLSNHHLPILSSILPHLTMNCLYHMLPLLLLTLLIEKAVMASFLTGRMSVDCFCWSHRRTKPSSKSFWGRELWDRGEYIMEAGSWKLCCIEHLFELEVYHIMWYWHVGSLSWLRTAWIKFPRVCSTFQLAEHNFKRCCSASSHV